MVKRNRVVLHSAVFLVLFCLFGCSSIGLLPYSSAHHRHGLFDHPPAVSRVKSVGDFQWPLRLVEVTSAFGRRGHAFHEGIDLRASSGTPVFASKGGIVLYADTHIKGYGKLVVIRHSDHTATIYAHNSKVLVHRGERVKQGQEIALSGSTGHVTGPHVHFEIRRGLAALDPLKYLPRPSLHVAYLR